MFFDFRPSQMRLEDRSTYQACVSLMSSSLRSPARRWSQQMMSRSSQRCPRFPGRHRQPQLTSRCRHSITPQSRPVVLGGPRVGRTKCSILRPARSFSSIRWATGKTLPGMRFDSSSSMMIQLCLPSSSKLMTEQSRLVVSLLMSEVLQLFCKDERCPSHYHLI
jgi:hypothetical protein